MQKWEFGVCAGRGGSTLTHSHPSIFQTLRLPEIVGNAVTDRVIYIHTRIRSSLSALTCDQYGYTAGKKIQDDGRAPVLFPLVHSAFRWRHYMILSWCFFSSSVIYDFPPVVYALCNAGVQPSVCVRHSLNANVLFWIFFSEGEELWAAGKIFCSRASTITALCRITLMTQNAALWKENKCFSKKDKTARKIPF